MVPRYQQPPRWSPAGDKFLIRYNDSKQKAAVWVVNIDGSGLKMLEGYRISTQPVVGAWSPTGSHLLYQHLDHLREDTYIVRTKEDGRGNTRITDKSIGAGFWAPYPLGWRE